MAGKSNLFASLTPAAGAWPIALASGRIDPLWVGASGILDQLTSAVGSIPMRGASFWTGLQPGTAGYFLQSAGPGLPLTWASVTAGSGGGGTASPLTTKGDIWGYSTLNARISVGSNGYVLTADSTQALGVKWAAVSAGSSGGSGTVNSGIATQLAYYATTGTAVSSTTAFTIGASGNPSIVASGSNQNISLQTSGSGFVEVLKASTNANAAIFRTTAANSYVDIRFYNDINSPSRMLQIGYTGSSYATTQVSGGSTGESGFITTESSVPLQFGTNATYRGQITGAGRWLFGTLTTDDGTNTIQTNGGIRTTSATVSSSTSTGSGIFGGGVGIAGAVFTGGAITTAAPVSGTAAAWKHGIYVTTAPSATGYVQLDINGTLYKLLTST